MDKQAVQGIDYFLEYFPKLENQILLKSPRYVESETRFTEEENGTGFFKEIRMPQMTLLQLSFDLKRDIRITDKDTQEDVGSAFVLEGEFTSHFEEIGKNPAPASQHHNLLYKPDFPGEHVFRRGTFQAIHLHYQVDFFKSLLDANDPRFVAVLEAIEKKKPLLMSETNLPLQHQMWQTIREMNQCSLKGVTKNIYLEAKALELFTLQIEQMMAVSNKRLGPGLSKADVEKLRSVKEFIEKNYLERITLPDLALRFGINEFKLKSGYKQLFGNPVYHTIHHLRMQTAAELLKNDVMNISEITDFVGYSHISHFSAAFKKKFGHPPSLSKARTFHYS
jgi:AraC family transcriptional activator of pyochelin receptor